MNIRCRLGKHHWDGCQCLACGEKRDQEHRWGYLGDECKCGKCGKTRDEKHKWGYLDDQCKCTTCGKTRDHGHMWGGTSVCYVCGAKREACSEAEKRVAEAARAFISERGTSWDHQGWLDFLAKVRAAEAGGRMYKDLQDDEIGLLLEREGEAARRRQAESAGDQRQPPRGQQSSAPQPAPPPGQMEALTSRVVAAFHRHLEKFQPELRREPQMQAALAQVTTAFVKSAGLVAEKVALSAGDGEMHSFSQCDSTEKVRLEVTTVPCRPGEARAFFARTPAGGYAEFLNRLMYFPMVYEPARAQGIQLLAHLIVVCYPQGSDLSFVIHLCVLPHGDGNQRYCPVGLTPIDLFSDEERKRYNIAKTR